MAATSSWSAERLLLYGQWQYGQHNVQSVDLINWSIGVKIVFSPNWTRYFTEDHNI